MSIYVCHLRSYRICGIRMSREIVLTPSGQCSTIPVALSLSLMSLMSLSLPAVAGRGACGVMDDGGGGELVMAG